MAAEDSSAKEGIAGYWFPVLITESLVILIINAITIIAFARIRHLQYVPHNKPDRGRSTGGCCNMTFGSVLVLQG